MEIVRVDKQGRLMISKEIRARLKIDESTPLIIEVVDENTIKIRIIQHENKDYTSDPLWKAIHNPVLLGKKVSSKELDEIKDEQWLN